MPRTAFVKRIAGLIVCWCAVMLWSPWRTAALDMQHPPRLPWGSVDTPHGSRPYPPIGHHCFALRGSLFA